MLLAHSAKADKGIPEQEYADHVSGVVSRAIFAAEIVAKYASSNEDLLKKVVRQSAEYHDLGKLDPENQAVLAGEQKAKKLPIQHSDAGTAYLIETEKNLLGAVLIRSHHIGLPDWPDEEIRGEAFFRDVDISIRQHVDRTLESLIQLHKKTIPCIDSSVFNGGFTNGTPSLFLRLALSCLADADHSDTAIHYKEYPAEEAQIALKPAKRLQLLDCYVAGLGSSEDERSRLRVEMYQACRNANTDQRIVTCDSPVGSGKTTAIMAHLLAQADVRGLRRVFVVLPFTNIITQSVEVYRKALVLPGENPEDVVAELHHRADFQSVESRHLTALWKAPIIVTTAVTFFETLASNTPATLRRLHNLPGSAIFVDESHAALPAKLLPLAWDWIKDYAKEWGCYWVLASGSLNRFWQIPEFDNSSPILPEIVSNSLRSRLATYEKGRVTYHYYDKPQTAEELINWIASLPGPRIVVFNTVQSAAVVASLYAKKFGKGQVEHLSTALSPLDRANTLKRIKARLKNQQYENDEDWTLIATSCVEAGIDFSFRTGARELGALVSLLQISGRVNRQGNRTDARVWTFRLAEIYPLKIHPGIKEAAQVLQKIFESEQEIRPELCTKALEQEIRMQGVSSVFEKLRIAEKQNRFPVVEKKFKVIDTDTRPVIVDPLLIKRISEHQQVDWKEIQAGSVQIWKYIIDALRIPELTGKSELYGWNLGYNDFIGYMAGVLAVDDFSSGTGEGTII